MSRDDVAGVLGPPERVKLNFLGDHVEARHGANVRHFKADEVVELSLLPTETLLFQGVDLALCRIPAGTC
jgi:hypothetical protein